MLTRESLMTAKHYELLCCRQLGRLDSVYLRARVTVQYSEVDRNAIFDSIYRAHNSVWTLQQLSFARRQFILPESIK